MKQKDGSESESLKWQRQEDGESTQTYIENRNIREGKLRDSNQIDPYKML